jgi:hypothetical protein
MGVVLLIVAVVASVVLALVYETRRCERVTKARWREEYREKDRLHYLRRAWDDKFIRNPDESEEEFIERFKRWLMTDRDKQ